MCTTFSLLLLAIFCHLLIHRLILIVVWFGAHLEACLHAFLKYVCMCNCHVFGVGVLGNSRGYTRPKSTILYFFVLRAGSRGDSLNVELPEKLPAARHCPSQCEPTDPPVRWGGDPVVYCPAKVI